MYAPRTANSLKRSPGVKLDTHEARLPKEKGEGPMCTDYFKGNILSLADFKKMHRHR
jgi:hypothetical protein